LRGKGTGPEKGESPSGEGRGKEREEFFPSKKGGDSIRNEEERGRLRGGGGGGKGVDGVSPGDPSLLLKGGANKGKGTSTLG